MRPVSHSGLGAVELLEQLVGLVETPHRIGTVTCVGMVIQGLLAVSLPDLIETEAMAGLGGQVQLTQGPLQRHGVFKGLKGGAAMAPAEAVHETTDQGGDP